MESGDNKAPGTAELKDNSSENLHVLLNTIEGINESRELKSLLEESMEAIRLVMSSAASSLMLLDEETGELNIILPTGPAKKEIKGKRIPKNKGIGGWVIENKQPYISNDLENSDIFWGEVAEEFKTNSIICVPLINKQNKAIGVLQALNKRRGEEFNPHDIPVFQALASHITLAIERVQKQEELTAQIKDKERLLSEFSERVQNSLGIISSLVEIDMEEINDEASKEVFQETHSRIQALKEIQSLLSRQKMADEVSLVVYLQRLATKICEAFSGAGPDNVEVFGDTVEAEAGKALISGFVLYEVLVKISRSSHRRDSNRKITVEVVQEENDQFSVKIGGFHPDFPQKFFEELESGQNIAAHDRPGFGVSVNPIHKNKKLIIHFQDRTKKMDDDF